MSWPRLGALPRALPITVLLPLAATVVGLLIGVALVAATGASVPEAVAAFWDGMAGSTFAFGASINRAVALTLVGLGFIFANRANLTNVGAEGQLAVGGIAATALALHGAERLPLGLAVIVPLVGGASDRGRGDGGRQSDGHDDLERHG